MSGLGVAIVGATGAVGEVLRAVLEERGFPLQRLHLLASARSRGRRLPFRDREIAVEALEDFDFAQVRIAFFSAGAGPSREHAPRAAAEGCVVIDNTSQFRYDDDIPLVVPECNAERIADWKRRGIIANPNCSTAQMVVALKPQHDAAGIARIDVATYQAVSGTGTAAIEELRRQSADALANRASECAVYAQPIAFNALPHIDAFMDNGYTREEMKMVWETRKILEDPDLRVNPTAVRVPVYTGHSEAVHLELRAPLGADEARALLRAAPGVAVVDDPGRAQYPTARTHAAGSDSVYVGRIRNDPDHPDGRGLSLWVVSDNLRKGAATNSAQIAELWLERFGAWGACVRSPCAPPPRRRRRRSSALCRRSSIPTARRS